MNVHFTIDSKRLSNQSVDPGNDRCDPVSPNWVFSYRTPFSDIPFFEIHQENAQNPKGIFLVPIVLSRPPCPRLLTVSWIRCKEWTYQSWFREVTFKMKRYWGCIPQKSTHGLAPMKTGLRADHTPWAVFSNPCQMVSESLLIWGLWSL